jgi:alkylation response protein AidB-like acyl-CoA dehydrogenase
MNFEALELDDDTRAFWADARAFFDEHVTDEVHEDERRTGNGYNVAFHRALGTRSWAVPRWPAELGGPGLDAVRARIVELELERSGAPEVITQTTPLPAIAVRAFANDALKAEVLPGIADGSVNICLGYTEPDCGSDLASARTRAVRDGDAWVINGQKMFTTGAQFCQYCLCLTRTDPDAPKHRGLTVFLVPLDLPGIEIRPIRTLGGERTNFVHFDDVRVSDHHRIGGVHEGWSVLQAPLAAEHGMAQRGDLSPNTGRINIHATRRLLEAAVAHLREDRDGDGRPRIDDPTVRERLARVALEIEVAAVAPGPLARVYASEMFVRAASVLLDLMGPAGALPHGADGAVAGGVPEELFRFAPGTRIYGGTTDVFRNLIAEQYLKLPRSTPKR